MVVPAMQLASKIPDMSVQLWSSALLKGASFSWPYSDTVSVSLSFKQNVKVRRDASKLFRVLRWVFIAICRS